MSFTYTALKNKRPPDVYVNNCEMFCQGSEPDVNVSLCFLYSVFILHMNYKWCAAAQPCEWRSGGWGQQLRCKNNTWTEMYSQCTPFNIIFINRLSNCKIKDPCTRDFSTVIDQVKSPVAVYGAVGHTEYRECSPWDCLLVHYLSHPLKLLIMLLHFYILFFAPVDLFNSLCLIASIFLSGFTRHTFTQGHRARCTAIQWVFKKVGHVPV